MDRASDEQEGLALLWCAVCRHFFGGGRNEHGFLVFRCSGCGLAACQLPLECDARPLCGQPTPVEGELGRHLVNVIGQEEQGFGERGYETTEVAR